MSLELLLAPVTEYNTVSKPHSLKDPRFIQEHLYSPNEDATFVKPKKYNTDARVINRLPVYQSIFKPKRTTDTNAFRTAFREQFALKQETPTFIGWSEIDKFRWVSTATTRQLESVRPENYFGVRLYTPAADTHVIIDFDFRIATEAQLRSDGYYLIDTNEKPVSFDDPRFIDVFKSVKNIWLDRKTYKPISRSYIIRESPETQQLATLSNEISTARNDVEQLIRDQILYRNLNPSKGITTDSKNFIDKVNEAIESMSIKTYNSKESLAQTAILLNNQLGGENTERESAMTSFFIVCITPNLNTNINRYPFLQDDIKREYIFTRIQNADLLFGEKLNDIDKMSIEEYSKAIDDSYLDVKSCITRERKIPDSVESKQKGTKIVYPALFTPSYNAIKQLMIDDFKRFRKIEEPKQPEQSEQPKQPEQSEQSEQPEQPENIPQ